ncbi:hypothetical protein BP6252_13190 [Coleophoma cylindrospora]|uniref:Uncharacterized protein n=1 Tax=Coleophoma cylindrospora TaxID=1849047 RepID=A0A3D8QB51_9HELO|nr:hypothetical protein BP6252_13190 [Coleophoma cylindrospora]
MGVNVLGSICFCYLSHLEHMRNIKPSTLLIIYFLFSFLLDFSQLRTLWAIPHNYISATVFTVATATKVWIVLLEAKSKRTILNAKYTDYAAEAIGNVFSRVVFWWLNRLLGIGYGKTLSLDDLPSIDPSLSSSVQFQQKWNKLPNKDTRHSLLLAAIAHFKWDLLSGIPPRLLLIGFTYSQPFLVKRVINLVSQPTSTSSNNAGYGMIGAYALVYIGMALSTTRYQHLTYRVITKLRGNLIPLIYNKTLSLSVSSANQSASVTLMSTDVERICAGLLYMHDSWGSTIEIGLALWLLWLELGVASVTPIVVALVCTLAAMKIAGSAAHRQKSWIEAIQTRVGATATMLGAMKSAKMSGLIDRLSTNIQNLRVAEIHASRKFRVLLIIVLGLAYTSNALSPVISFGIFSFIDRHRGSGTLDTATAFASLTLFSLLATPLSQLIEASTQLMAAVGCIDRIREYLVSDEREEHRELAATSPVDADLKHEKAVFTGSASETSLSRSSEAPNHVITIRGGSAGWDKERPHLIHDILIEIQRSQWTFIVGPVGCGKSTLLHAMLGETTTFSGSLNIGYLQVAYCSQTPWITNGTVQENILGISVFDQPWYDVVIRACALEQDLHGFPRGDKTLLGSKGTTLSGGQRQRIALARALYSRVDVLILDDVFSGLDSTTEEVIFIRLFGSDGLFRKARTTVILTTNSVDKLSYADHIIVLGRDGTIAQQGTFEDLNSTAGYLRDYSAKQHRNRGHKVDPTTPLFRVRSTLTTSTVPESDSRRVGDMMVYKYYFSIIGWKVSLVFVALTIWPVFCLSFPSIWVMLWAKSNEIHPNQDIALYLGIYAMLGVMAISGIVFLCWHLMVNLVPRTSGTLHRILLNTTLRAPMSFFSNTDTGVTLNRFSQDLELIDMELPIALLNIALASMLCLAQIIIVSVSARYIAAAIPVCLIVFYVVQNFYLRTSRQLRLLDIEAKSPLFSHFLETLSGLSTLRAFCWEEESKHRNQILLDQSQKPFYLLFCVQRWLNLVLDLSFAGLAVILITIAVTTRGKLSGGFIGVALVNVVSLSTSLKDLITYWTILETSIGAVSRVRSFALETQSENRLEEREIPDSHWPAKGSIDIRGISASYLGKSSLVSTIFRMLELDSGSIIIDGIDISTVPRQEIRSRLVSISQEPYILSGTVRLNVDPFETASDEDVIKALQTVKLWEVISTKGGLSVVVSENILSHGQRQLLCLARALLRKGSILVLDEATSSVDEKTDELMQQIIRTHFQEYTIIAIAHRLNTILDFDKIAVIEKGCLLEFENAAELLSRQSAFSDLYRSSTGGDDAQDDNSSGASQETEAKHGDDDMDEIIPEKQCH